MNKVGCIYTVTFRYYDIRSNKVKAKKRPFLIIKQEKSKAPVDLTALPISSITDKSRIDDRYDIKIEKHIYPKFNLSRDVSYIRTNKIQTINETDLIDKVSEDMSKVYPELYETITNRVREYYSEIF